MKIFNGLTAVSCAALIASCGQYDEAENEEITVAEVAVDTTEAAIPYWSDEPLLTQEDIEAGRYDDSWRRAASVDSLDALDTLDVLPTIRSITIPETWDDIGAIAVVERRNDAEGEATTMARGPEINLPLGGQVAGPSVLYTQVLLDRARFSPGAIDGRWGQNTEKAVYWFQRAEGLPATGVVDSTTYRRLVDRGGAAGSLIVRHVLTAQEVEGPFVEIPEGVYAQAGMECLCYTSLGEKLAEEFHVTPELLASLNAQRAIDSLSAGDTLAVPAVNTEADSVSAPIERLVISDQGEYVHAMGAGGRIVAHFPSTLGSAYDPSPEGRLTVMSITRRPNFYYQPDLLSGVPDSARPATLPPGPNNPVGLVWIDLSKEHYGIHGTRDPVSLGYETSSGCVRLTNWDALWLAGGIEPGLEVTFIDPGATIATNARRTPPYTVPAGSIDSL